jgi:mannose-1-phosphate guanylyltransferase
LSAIDIADKVVVGNIDNCHLSKKVLDKSNTSYVDIISRLKIPLRLSLSAFASHPEDILVITPSDHIIDEMQLYEAAIQEA